MATDNSSKALPLNTDVLWTSVAPPSTRHPNGGSGLTVEFWPRFLFLSSFFPHTIFWVTAQESQWKNGFSVAGGQRSPGLSREWGATPLVQVADGWEIVILLKRQSQTAQPGAQPVPPPALLPTFRKLVEAALCLCFIGINAFPVVSRV